MIFANYCQSFLTHQAEVQRNSAGEMRQKRMCLDNHLIPFFGPMVLDAIGSKEVAAYVTSKMQAGSDYAPTTINNHLALLSRLLHHAFEEHQLERLPVIKRIKDPRARPDNFLTDEQTLALLQAADSHRNPRWRLLMLLALNTGMRIGELLALDWSSVDLPRGRLTICASLCRQLRTQKSTKSGKPRRALLNKNAHAALTLLAQLTGSDAPTGLVMPSNYETAHKAMKMCAKRAGLPSTVTWHTLRHTFASNLVMSGVPILTVSKLLGHSSYAMTERYSHLHEEKGRDALAVLDRMRFVGPREAV